TADSRSLHRDGMNMVMRASRSLAPRPEPALRTRCEDAQSTGGEDAQSTGGVDRRSAGVSARVGTVVGRVRTSLDVDKLGAYGPALLEQMRSRLGACRSFYGSWSNRTALGGFGVDEKTSRGSGNSTTPSRTRRTLPGGTGPARWSSIDGTDESRS